MKILQLNLENITSLAGQHSIDFEQEPLSSAGLIAITGMTGSGKSSLLDAMCLALFNEVPRLRGANGALEDITGDSIQINAPSNLLRRGTAFGFAEVVFLAQDNKRYSAKWSVKRARDKATGKLQGVQRELRCLEDNQIIATKATEVSQQIDRLLGLDFKQFTKTVLLAQSEVTAFIKANDNERAALLEYLTDSDIYSKIGTLAFDKNKQAASLVADIERKIGEQQPLSEKERLTLQQQISQVQTQQTAQEQQLKQTEQHIQWYQQLDALQQSIQQAHQHERLAQQQWAAFEPQQQRLKQLEQFEPIRSQFEQLTQANQQLADKQQLEKKKQQALQALQQQSLSIEQQFNTSRLQQEEVLQRTQALALFDQDQRATRQFAQIAQQRHDLFMLDANTLKLSLSEQQQQLEQQQQQLKTLEEQHQSPAQLTQQKQQLEQKLDKLKEFITRCDTITTLINQWQRIEQELHDNQQLTTTLQLQQTEQRQQVDAAQQTINNAKIQADTIERLWAQQQLLTQRSVEDLRHELKPNEPCMVCGSTEHPYATHEHLAAVLNQSIQQQHQQAKQHLEQCQEQWRNTDKQLATTQQQQQHVQQQLNKLALQQQQTLSSLEQSNPKFYQQIQVQLNPAYAHELLQDNKQQVIQQSKTLEQQIKQLDRQLTNWYALQQQLAVQQQKLDKRLQLDALEREYVLPLTMELQQQWAQDCQRTASNIQQQLLQRQTAQQTLESAKERRLELEQKLHSQQVQLQADIHALNTQLQEQMHALQQYQQKINDWKIKHPELDESTIQQLQQLSHADKNQLQDQQRQLEAALHKTNTTLSMLMSQQAEHQQSQPEAEREQLHEQLLQTQQTLQQTKEELHQLAVKRQLDEQIRLQAQRYTAELEKAKIEHHRWDKIASLIGSADGAKFKRIAQQYHLQMLVGLANQHLVQLTPRYEIRHVEHSLNLSIVDHFMNDEIRAVASLSGGESFLISLALALGIASMASGHTKLESLFIDEGFGTLDQNSLQMVMDALDRLQSQGRKVIVISHIAEMHERIPVQIQVIQQGAGASKIEIVG